MENRGPDSGKLFVVATPIGNRDDLSPRARQILGEVDLIAAEDTRRTGRLLSHFGVKTPLSALHEHNEERAVDDLIERLQGGAKIALVSDAGTPLISDPGYRLVTAAHASGVPLASVPGASAVTAALSVSGLPTDRFCFEGFLPAKTEARRAVLQALVDEGRTLVFLESVHKIAGSVRDMAELFGADRNAFVGRELTKMYEQCVAGSLGELAAALSDGRIPQKGEFVVIVAGRRDVEEDTVTLKVAAVLDALLERLPGREAVEVVAGLTGHPRNDVYRMMLARRDDR